MVRGNFSIMSYGEEDTYMSYGRRIPAMVRGNFSITCRPVAATLNCIGSSSSSYCMYMYINMYINMYLIYVYIYIIICVLTA